MPDKSQYSRLLSAPADFVVMPQKEKQFMAKSSSSVSYFQSGQGQNRSIHNTKTYLTGFTGLTGKLAKPHCPSLATGEAPQ